HGSVLPPFRFDHVGHLTAFDSTCNLRALFPILLQTQDRAAGYMSGPWWPCARKIALCQFHIPLGFAACLSPLSSSYIHALSVSIELSSHSSCAKPAVPILSTSPFRPRHPYQATLHMQGCLPLIASTRPPQTMPYTPARLPRPATELHKTLRPRIHKPNSSQQPGPAASLRAALVWSKEKEELMIACAQGDVNKVDFLFSTYYPSLNPDFIRDTKLRTPLLVACAGGKADVVRLLVRRGADVNNPVGDVMGNRPLDLGEWVELRSGRGLIAVISNNVDCVLALLESGAQIPSFAPSPPPNSSPPRPRRTRTPLDLAQSRLDMLIRARNQERAHVAVGEDTEMEPMERSAAGGKDDILGQIIQLLKHFIRVPTPTTSASTASCQQPADKLSELDALTDQLSRIQLRGVDGTLAGPQCDSEDEVGVLKRLRGVVEGMRI
ncbi:hypothetical protein BC937DRAFT_93045, partial [Endogone sp. FLAS-F59071]